MAIAQRVGDPAGLPDPASGRAGRRGAVLAVVISGLGVTIVLVMLTMGAYHQNELRLLSLQSRLISSAVATEEPLYVGDHLGGAASLAAATNGDARTFRKAVSDSVTAKGPFASASLWRVAGGSAQLLAEAGTRPLLAPGSARAKAFLRQAAASKAFVVTRLDAPHALRIGYAAAASGPHGSYVVYAEAPLPPSRRMPAPANSPISQLNLAIYLGRSRTAAALLETTSTAPLPLRGTTFTSTIPFGNTVLTLMTAPRSALSGNVSRYLPLAVAVGGLLITALAGLLTERLIRRRHSAERRTGEMGQLYVAQRSVAETLQHALLPQEMPAIPGMQIAVRYLPGASDVDIGGDWYDVVPLDDGRFVFVIGDVSGRGVRAAAVMASLHYASRAYALEGHSPAVIVDHLARMLHVGRDGHFATVLCGLVDVRAHEVVLANAGHLPPLVHGGSKACVVPMTPGPPVGVPKRAPAKPALVTTATRSTLLAYTDGLVERRGESLDAGIERLQEAAARSSASLEDMLDSIITELTEDSPNDDIALIGLRWLN